MAATETTIEDCPPPTRTKEEAELDRLRNVLAQEYWNFSLGDGQFNGFSEGVCILGGIAPRLSQMSRYHFGVSYGPAILPGALGLFNRKTVPHGIDGLNFLEEVGRSLVMVSALGLKGLVSPIRAISTASIYKIVPPWLGVAADDLHCAQCLPQELRSNDEVRRNIRREIARHGGQSRAAKNAKTKAINSEVRRVFNELQAIGFGGLRTKGSDRPNGRAIADAIYEKLTRHELVTEEHLPSLETIVKHVQTWLKDNKND